MTTLGINSFSEADYEHIAALMRQAIEAQDHTRLRAVLANHIYAAVLLIACR